MVRAVGEVLRLETETRPKSVNCTAFPNHVPVEMVPGVKLHPRLCCQHIEHAAGTRVHDPRGKTQRARFAVYDVIVVVANAELQLLVLLIDTLAYTLRCAEIERRPLDGGDFACRDEILIYRCKQVRVDRDQMIDNLVPPLGAG